MSKCSSSHFPYQFCCPCTSLATLSSAHVHTLWFPVRSRTWEICMSKCSSSHFPYQFCCPCTSLATLSSAHVHTLWFPVRSRTWEICMSKCSSSHFPNIFATFSFCLPKNLNKSKFFLENTHVPVILDLIPRTYRIFIIQSLIGSLVSTTHDIRARKPTNYPRPDTSADEANAPDRKQG